MRSLLRIARSLRRLILRFVISVYMLTGSLPAPMLRAFLEWLRDDLHPLDPRVPTVLRELAEAKDRCRV